MNAVSKPRDEAGVAEDQDDIERYVATFTELERQELAAAGAAIDIAILLHRVREHRGLNQAAAAALAGLHQQSVSRLEQPSGYPKLETMRAYLAALGYQLELNVIDLDSGEVAASLQLPPTNSRRIA